MATDLVVVKIGGDIVENPSLLEECLRRFDSIVAPKVLVHGGGKRASALSSRLGIPVEFYEGRRITSRESLEVATMVYAGSVNKHIVSRLQALGCDAIGLSGSDANVVEAVRRPVGSVDFGFVGDIQRVNSVRLREFLDLGLTPVLNAICHDGNGQLLNCNADTVAAEVAIAMSREFRASLHYCFAKNGVLEGEKLIQHLHPERYRELIRSGVVRDGMIPKLDNGFRAMEHGVHGVHVGSVFHIGQIDYSHTVLTL